MKNGCRIASLLLLLSLLSPLAAAPGAASSSPPVPPVSSSSAPPASASPFRPLSPSPAPFGSPAISAAARGNPWINLLDGEAVPTTYAGAAGLVQSLDTAQPLALTADDFDEDGMPDLAAGYAAGNGGLVALHFGSLDYLWPDGPEADARRAAGLLGDAPFLPEARLFSLPIVPNHLGAGDFDNDGHRDVVAAARGSSALYLLPGDGQGGFGQAQGLPLPGAVTAFAAGEVNRRDGLQDLVVAVEERGGPQLLVFEGPTGALRWEPEVIPLPAPTTSIVVGQMDDHYCMDIAAACGNDLVLVHGRDRQLSVLFSDSPPTLTVHALPYPILALALGDFIPGETYTKELALLAADGTIRFLVPTTAVEIAQLPVLEPGTWNLQPATSNLQLATCNVSSLPGDDLAVLDPANNQVHLVVAIQSGTSPDENGGWNAILRPWSVALDTAGLPAALLPLRLNKDAFGDLVIFQAGLVGPVVAATAPLAVYVVDDEGQDGDRDPSDGICATAAGRCTLLAAAQTANANPGADEVRFNLPFGTHIWRPNGQYVYFSGPVTIDNSGSPRVQIRHGLEFGSGSASSTVRGLLLNGNGGGTGWLEMQGNGNIVEGTWIGVSLDGTAMETAAGNPALLLASSNNLAGGTVPAARNLLVSSSSLYPALQLCRGVENTSRGNFLGTDLYGTTALGAGGLLAGGGYIGCFSPYDNTTIGGTTAAARNVFGARGMSLSGVGHLVQGNFVGTDVNGTTRLGDGTIMLSNRFFVQSPAGSTVGGTAAGAANVIADGVYLDQCEQALIQGNKIGVDVHGEGPLACSVGVQFRESYSCTLGGTAEGAGNTIAHCLYDGVSVFGGSTPSTGIAILGNRIYGNGLPGYWWSDIGIDLNADEYGDVTPNDPCDVDVGANNLQNYPTLLTATVSGGQVTIEGYLDSTPNESFHLEFFANTGCDPSGYGQGRDLLGTLELTTDGDCNAPFVVTYPARGRGIAATATSADGSTSEFSNCIQLPRFKVSEPDRVTFVRPITYTLGVKNTTAAPTAVNVQDPLPAGTVFVPGSLWASQGTPSFDGSRVTWDGTLDPGVVLEVRFQVSTTCDAPELIHNVATVTQQGEIWTLEAETTRVNPVYLDLAAHTPAPPAGAQGLLIDPSPTLSWSGFGKCGTDFAAGDQVAYRVYLKEHGDWQEVGAYPNCDRSIALPAGTLPCGPDGDPHPYTWKVEAVDLQNPCRDPVAQAWGFTTASCRPAVTVKPQYEKYFLTDLELENLYRAEVDWNGPARQGNGEALKQEVRFDLNGVEVVEPGLDWGAAHLYNMGTDFRAGLLGGNNVLRIRAVNTEGYTSRIAVLQPQVFPIPAWATEWPMGGFEIDPASLTVTYRRTLQYPNPPFRARYEVPGWVPYMGKAFFGIMDTYAAVEAEASTDGSGAVTVGGNTGVQLTENAQVLGRLYGRGEVQLGPPAGLDLVGAALGLEITGRIAQEMGVADLIPAVRAAEEWPLVGRLVQWFNERAQVEGAIEPQIQIETRFRDVEDHLRFDSGTGTGKIKLMLTLSLEVFDWLKAAIFGGGEPRVVVQVPAAEPWGYLQEIAIRLFAGLRLTVWRFEGEWERGITCSLPTAGCQSDEGEELLAPTWRLLPRDYAGPGYATFVANTPHAPPLAVPGSGTTETPLVLDVYPLADPALAVRDDGARVALWVHDDVSRPIGQGEEIAAAHWNGAIWVTATLTADAYQDFNPQVNYDAQGDAVAVWERSNTVWFSPTLTITYARSFEIATAAWDHGTGLWSAPLTLTHDSLMDVTPQLARGGDGALLALWRTGEGVDLLGTMTNPLTLTAAWWDGTSWSPPSAALAGLVHVLDVDVAVYSATRAALVLALDGDGDLGTGSDGEVAYATWDGAAWSALTPLTSDAITDSHPALAYDAAGAPVVVWLRGADLVQQVGWTGTPAVVRPASTSGAFLDFDLVGAADGGLALLWQTLGADGADAAYALYDPLHASWGADNALMADTALDESFAPALAADALLLAYQKVAIEFVTLTYDISPTLTITVPHVPQPVQTDLYFLEHAIGHDLAVGAGDVVVSPPNPAPGATALITATIHNAGDLAIAGGVAAFFDGDPGAGGTRIGITQTLPSPFRAATTATVSVAWTVPAGDASHTLYVVADPAGVVFERDETNNVATLATVQPDLAVDWAHSSHTTTTLTLTARVVNAGVTAAAGPFTVAFRAADPYTGTLLGTAAVTSGLPAGDVVTVTVVLTEAAGLAGAGQRFWAVADDGDAVPEADEGNNAGYAALGVLPDLAPDAYDIAGAGPVVVTVRNAGVVPANDITLVVWDGGFSGTVLYSGTVGRIPPGGSAAATFVLPAGTYELWAQADPHHLIPESDEGNNLAIWERTIWHRVYLPLVQR